MSTKAEKAALIRSAKEKDELIRITFPKKGDKCMFISECNYWWCQHNNDCLDYTLYHRNKAKQEVAIKKTKTPIGVSEEHIPPRVKIFKHDRDYNGVKFIFCHYCGTLIPFSKITRDHIIPRSKGGNSKKENLVPACRWCNTEKSSMDYLDYIQYRYRSGKTLGRVARQIFEHSLR